MFSKFVCKLKNVPTLQKMAQFLILFTNFKTVHVLEIHSKTQNKFRDLKNARIFIFYKKFRKCVEFQIIF